MKTWQKQLLLFLVLLAVGLPLFFLLRGTGEPPPPPVYTGPTGAYGLALVDRSGRALSDSRGGLQVLLDPFTLYRNRPDQRTDSFTTGRYGFRGGYRGKPRPLVVLGGSAAFGQGLAADRDCFTALLDGMIGDREVVNAAVVGYLAGQELALMVHRLDDLHPSFYVVFDGWNELFDQWLACRRDGPWDYGFMNLHFHIEQRLRDLLVIEGRGDAAPARPGGLTRREEARRAGVTKEMTHHRKKNADESTEAEGDRILGTIQREYHASLGRMADFARARGAGFLVVFQPELGGKRQRTAEEDLAYDRWCDAYGGYRDLEFSAAYSAFVRRAADWCAAEGIPSLDLHHHPAFRDDEERLYFDVVHLNERGHQLAARLIRERLAEIGLPDPAEGRDGP